MWNCAVIWTVFGTAFLWNWNENWPCPVLWPLLSFPNLLAFWVQHFNSSIFKIWYSSAGIPSPPQVLFVVILPKVHLISHSRISGSRWLTTPSWLSRSLRSFLYSSSVYSCHLLLIPSASARSIPFLPFIVPALYCSHLCMKCSPAIFNFLEEISSLPILSFSSISLHCSLKKAFLSLLAIPLQLPFFISGKHLGKRYVRLPLGRLFISEGVHCANIVFSKFKNRRVKWS